MLVSLSLLPNLPSSTSLPNGPYTLLKIYSYKLHGRCGLGPGPGSLPLGLPPLYTSQHHPGPRRLALRLQGGSQLGRDRRGHTGGGRGKGGRHLLVLQVQTAEGGCGASSLSIYRYLQKKVMSHRSQSCKRNAPSPSLPQNYPPAHPRP